MKAVEQVISYGIVSELFIMLYKAVLTFKSGRKPIVWRFKSTLFCSTSTWCSALPVHSMGGERVNYTKSYLVLLQRHKISSIKAIKRMPPATDPAIMEVLFWLCSLFPVLVSTLPFPSVGWMYKTKRKEWKTLQLVLCSRTVLFAFRGWNSAYWNCLGKFRLTTTVEVPVSGHPREAGKVSATGAGHLQGCVNTVCMS